MRRTSSRPTRAFACGLAAALLLCLSHLESRAGTIGIFVQAGSESGSFQLNVPDTTGSFDWKPANPVTVTGANGASLGTINGLSGVVDTDPNVSLTFFVTAGAVPTTFTLVSPTVSFAPLVNPEAFASAAITLTDADSDGASALGLFTGGNAYTAVYNGGPTFANLVIPVNAAIDDTKTTNDRFPLSGTSTILGSVTSIQSSFSFTLSANDLASGTSNFNVVPEPSGLVLAALGGVVLLWRVRRRAR